MIFKYVILFFTYSLIGWIIEVIGKLITTKKFVNRGFLIGPICPIYGVGGLIISLTLKDYTNAPLVLFGMSILICSVLEYFTSYLMEKLFNTRWWDYSNYKYNINGRICLETLLPFGLLGITMIYIINPILFKFLNIFSLNIIKIISIILLIIFITDIIISFNIILKITKNIKIIKKDATEEISKKVKQIITKPNILQKRIFNAFPNIKTKLQTLKNIIKR